MCKSLFLSSILPSLSARLLIWFLIMKVASLVKVLSAGHSWDMLFSFPKIDYSLYECADLSSANSWRLETGCSELFCKTPQTFSALVLPPLVLPRGCHPPSCPAQQGGSTQVTSCTSFISEHAIRALRPARNISVENLLAVLIETGQSMTLTVAFSASDPRLNQFCPCVRVEPGSVTWESNPWDR